jgi:anaerobic magnesium-protoporphyrin IX monomethyl ester cyclase
MKILFVVYDNGSFDHNFPMGIGAIAAVLKKEGHELEIWNQDLHHWPDDNLRIFLDKNKFDAVVISLIAGYYQYAKCKALSKAINSSKQRPIYIIGGYGPTPEPEFFLRKMECDIVALGEGEITAVKLFDALDNHKPLEEVPGIGWIDASGEFNVTPRPPQVEDLDSLPWAPYELFPMEYYRLLRINEVMATDFAMPMMSARGCTFKCTFCYRMDPGYRKRNPELLLDEVEYLFKEYDINYVVFEDDLLMSSVQHTEEVCRSFIKRKLPVKWACNGRLNYCSPELLKLMRDAGCVFINYGIESMDRKVLNSMKKGLSPKMITEGVGWTLDSGISPGLNFIFGYPDDNKETIKKSVDFLLQFDNQAQKRTIRPVTAYPGSPIYYDAIKLGLLDKENPAEDFYENKHLNSDLISTNFTKMDDETFYECLNWANKILMENYYDAQKTRTLAQIEYLYETKDVEFRGFRGEHIDSKDKKEKTLRNWEMSRVGDGDRFASNQENSERPPGIKSTIAPSRIVQ